MIIICYLYQKIKGFNMEDYSKYNQIDTECSVIDEDDIDGFGSIYNSSTLVNSESNFVSDNDRNYNKNTGIIIDLNDGDVDLDIKVTPKKTLPHNNDEIEIKTLPSIKVNDLSDLNKLNSFKGFNEIDTECNLSEDDLFDDDFGGKSAPLASSTKKLFDFDDEDEIIFEEKELVDEEILEEKKKKKHTVTPGQVEDDYWDKLSKKHKDSNVKGAYNTSLRFVGDPKAEMDFFNHVSGSDGSSSLISTSITGSGESSGEATAASTGEGGMGESLDKYKQLYEDLLYLTGFDVCPQEDGKFTVKDVLGSSEDKICANKCEILDYLKPFIKDCIIVPLQVKTKENFDDYADWCNWYTMNKDSFPQCQQDIDYCDLLCNHINEI